MFINESCFCYQITYVQNIACCTGQQLPLQKKIVQFLLEFVNRLHGWDLFLV